MRELISSKIDQFVHPKTNRISLCYRINYRSMDRQVRCVLIFKGLANISSKVAVE